MSVDSVQLRWIGHQIHAETSITVDLDIGLVAAHKIAHDAEGRLCVDVRKLTAATVHVGPSTG